MGSMCRNSPAKIQKCIHRIPTDCSRMNNSKILFWKISITVFIFWKVSKNMAGISERGSFL